ncbi:MAG: CotH kinase family protein [Pseudomonadota bacterium]|nr:CotH kinase family protein [Pseudomonadota bacterium]
MRRTQTLLAPVLLLAACVSDDDNLNPVPDDPAPDPATRTETVGDAPLRLPVRHDGVPNPAYVFAETLADDARAQTPPDDRTDSPAWEAFYDPNAVHEVRILLSPEARDDLERDGRNWVPAFVTVDGIEFPNAGVHRKGSTTWQGLSQKPSMKIKLQEYGEGPRLIGLERITLNNMVSDPAQAREVIALRLWRALGAVATRASWAKLWIDDQPYGVYSNIESLDDEWLQRRYDRYDGDLWEANDDADFTAGGLPAWELAEGLGDTTRLEALADALNGDAPTFEQQVGHLVDTDQFLQYWATCLVTGATDGYPFHLNDAYMYADPADGGRFDFVPWGMDEAWDVTFNPWVDGLLARACEADADCAARLDAAVLAALTTLEGLDVDAMVSEAYSVSEPLLSDDERRPYTGAAVAIARAELRARIAAWPGLVRQQLGL